MSTSKLPLRQLLVAAAIWAVSPVGAEIAFRVLGSQPPTELEGLYQQLPNGNYAQRPSVNADANWFGAKFSVHTDGLGFRCDSKRQFAVQPGDQLDILIVGDSQAYGQGVDFQDSVAGSFIQQAARDGIRVANVGTGGHLLRNQHELLERIRTRANLRVKRYVVLITPYLLNWPNDISRVTVGPDGRLYGSTVNEWKLLMVELKTRSVLPAKVRDAVRSTILRPQTHSAVTNMALSEYATGNAETQRAKNFLTFMASFQAWAKEQGSDVQLVYTPLALEFDFEHLKKAAQAAGVAIDRDSPYRTAAGVAKQLGIPLHDMRPALQAFQERGETLTLQADAHYNQSVSVSAGRYAWSMLRQSIASTRAGRLAES